MERRTILRERASRSAGAQQGGSTAAKDDTRKIAVISGLSSPMGLQRALGHVAESVLDSAFFNLRSAFCSK